MLITAITQQKRDPSRYNIFIICLCTAYAGYSVFQAEGGAGGGGGYDCLYPQKPDLH